MPNNPTYPQRQHPRLAGYDYGTPGYYFVTICIQDRLPLFGSVVDAAMCLSSAGELARDGWRVITQLHPGIAIDVDIALPDHVHAIVVLEDDPRRTLDLPDVVHRYKSLTTKRYAQAVRELGWEPFAGRLWQESFYDHVIRDDADLDAVRRYIAGNGQVWEVKRSKVESWGR
jgi:REP element-mobilizing transposase RayT